MTDQLLSGRNFLHTFLSLIAASGLALSGAGCGESPPAPSPTDSPATSEPAPAPLSVTEPGPTTDLQALIDAQIDSGAKEITIPPGTYRVKPHNRQHLLLKDLRDVTILADGVEMICTETTRAITIENCENLKLRGLTIDYDPLPFTQARIVALSPDRRHLEVEMLAGYPSHGDPLGSLEIFDPSTRRLRGRITYFSTKVEATGEGRATLTPLESQAGEAGEEVGDIAVFRATDAPGGSIPHTIMATDSEHLVLENVTLHAAVTFGFFENRCHASQYLHCRVIRRPADDDLVVRELPRLRSGNADAFHSKNARKGPLYEGCIARFMGDDAIAINGDFHFITASNGPTLRVLAKHDMNMHPGDEVQIFTFDGKRLPNQKIVALTRDGSITEDERSLLIQSSMNARLRETALHDAWQVTLDADVEVPPGSVICSANRIGNGFAIRDCEVGFNRSRGLLVKAGQGEITGNTIEGSVITAILISPEYWWLEAGFADDLVIAGNRILDSDGIGIAVVAVGGDGDLAPAGAFRNLTVRDNVIQGGPAPGLLLTSIRGLTTENNHVEIDPEKSLYSWQIGPWGRKGVAPEMKVHVEE